jgi:hypothetical protein
LLEAEISDGEMAKGCGGGLLLPVSADGAKGNGGGGGAAGDAALFKGSAMTRLGATAALSYMACSGTCCVRSAPSRLFWSFVACWGNLGDRVASWHSCSYCDLLLPVGVSSVVEFSYYVVLGQCPAG